MRRLIMVLMAAVLVVPLVMAGCVQNTVNTAENDQKSMVPEAVRSKYVSTDGFLQQRLRIMSIDKETLPSGLLQVQVTFRSERVGVCSEFWSWFTGDNPYKIEYKFDWLDDKGMQVFTAAGTWKELELMPGETMRVQSVAPNARCKDFMLSMKEYGE
ncbi:MAG: YcfL family protein [Victivallales bacterium]|nr:YcfL family protein [Victivallales bacterium]